MAYHKKYPVVGDVAKLDMLYMYMCHGLSQNIKPWLITKNIQWLVMWQSWICYTCMAYHKISSGWCVAKLDMLYMYMLPWLITKYPLVGHVAKLDIQHVAITFKAFTFLD